MPETRRMSEPERQYTISELLRIAEQQTAKAQTGDGSERA